MSLMARVDPTRTPVSAGRRARTGFGLVALALLGAAGCRNFQDDLTTCISEARCPDAGEEDGSGNPEPPDAGTLAWRWVYTHPQHPKLWDVWAASSSEVWVVGKNATVLHFQQGQWSEGPAPDGGPDGGSNLDFVSVTGCSPTQVLLAGRYFPSDGRVWSWKNGSWSAPQVTDAWLDLDCAGPGSAWAAGEFGTAASWTGADLTEESTPSGADLFAVRAFADAGVWAAGAYGTLLHRTSGWRDVRQLGSFDDEPTLNDLGGNTPDLVWAVGNFGTILRVRNEAQVQALDAGTQAHLFGVWAAGPEDVWAVGEAGLILHWDGQTWSTAHVEGTHLYAVHGSGPEDIWAVGDQGVVLHYGRR